MAQIIYGIHPVQEALKSPHLQIEKILIGTQTPHQPLQSILDLADKGKSLSRSPPKNPSNE